MRTSESGSTTRKNSSSLMHFLQISSIARIPTDIRCTDTRRSLCPWVSTSLDQKVSDAVEDDGDIEDSDSRVEVEYI